MNIKCDIILPVCDQFEFTKKCIESIIKNTDTPYRLIIINNGSNPDTRKFINGLDKDKKVETTVIHNKSNVGWVKALNKGIELSNAPYVCFQNDDTLVTQGWLKKMITILNMRDNFGLINPTWEGRRSNVSVDQYNGMLEERHGRAHIETDWCRGFSVVLKRAVVERIGNIDEIYGLAYFDDVDYSVTAIETGFLCLRALNTYVYHHRNVTFFEVLKGRKWNELHEKNKLIYYKKWGKPLKISLMLTPGTLQKEKSLNEIVSMVYRLARRQHRVDILCSDKKIREGISHTNVRVRCCPPLVFSIMAGLGLHINAKRKIDRRYDAVFINNMDLIDRFSGMDQDKLKIFGNGKQDFHNFVEIMVDFLKEKTKESV